MDVPVTAESGAGFSEKSAVLRWVLAAVAAVLPPGLNLVAIVGLWAAAIGFEKLSGLAPAALLTAASVTTNLVLYTAA